MEENQLTAASSSSEVDGFGRTHMFLRERLAIEPNRIYGYLEINYVCIIKKKKQTNNQSMEKCQSWANWRNEKLFGNLSMAFQLSIHQRFLFSMKDHSSLSLDLINIYVCTLKSIVRLLIPEREFSGTILKIWYFMIFTFCYIEFIPAFKFESVAMCDFFQFHCWLPLSQF